jgi:hypothetical protein
MRHEADALRGELSRSGKPVRRNKKQAALKNPCMSPKLKPTNF